MRHEINEKNRLSKHYTLFKNTHCIVFNKYIFFSKILIILYIKYILKVLHVHGCRVEGSRFTITVNLITFKLLFNWKLS